MIRNVRLGPSLAFLILAALTGLVGFFIVYHYASFERPIQRFAVVIDAGSTQTRSNLYSISLDPSRFINEERENAKATPMSDVIQVREVASCVNGGPLAAISSPNEANRLLGRCLQKFAAKIKRLDFLAAALDEDGKDLIGDDDKDRHLDSEEVDKQMALLDHRVNSVTHIHLGATAGMRALELLDPSKAEQKIHWIRDSIALSNSNLLAGTVYMNPGFVGIIEGTSEASFGWLSVNFACDKLQIDTTELRDDPIRSERQQQQQLDSEYFIETNLVDSIGTLELGGASAQVAFQVQASNSSQSLAALNGGMEADSVDLFGNNYHLVTRSDLCLGMSQAILRANYILMREFFERLWASSFDQATLPLVQEIEIENPCQQKGSRSIVSSGIVDSILGGACLEVSSEQRIRGEKFKQFMSASPQQVVSRLRIVGTGQVSQCDRLLWKLIEPQECRKLFSLCPESKNKQPPPEGMPFVTISGYNKALQVLNLSRQSTIGGPTQKSAATIQAIEDKLGGYPIDYGEFEQRTNSFCSLDVNEFPAKFPNMNKHFYAVNCLQVIYIRKLLTEFYQFNPITPSWSQIRFLLFPIGGHQADGQAAKHQQQEVDKGKEKNIDIGWTLGLLLNATSWEVFSEKGERSHDIIFHHGASVQFVIRTTVFLMFACVFLAGSLIVCSLVLARRKHRSAYICHSAQGSAERVSPPQNSL